MAKGSDHLQPLGICHRFFNFIMNNLIGQGIKRVTLGRDGTIVARESVEVPIEDSSRNVKMKSNVKRLSKSNGEIVIEFRHIEGSGNGLTVSDLDHRTRIAPKSVARKESSQSESAPNGAIMLSNPEKINDAGIRGNYKGPREIKQPHDSREAGSKKMVPLPPEESAGNREKEDEKDIAIHQRTSSGNDPEDAVPMPRRPFRPLLMSAASNINEKADDFIRSRKEAMMKALQP